MIAFSGDPWGEELAAGPADGRMSHEAGLVGPFNRLGASQEAIRTIC